MSMDAADHAVEAIEEMRAIYTDPYARAWDRAAARSSARLICRAWGWTVPEWAREMEEALARAGL